MRRVVVGIPASYDKNQNLETDSTKKYLNYLEKGGAECVMTTAGTSHFNFLSIEEIHRLNEVVINNFSGKKIIGIPPLSTRESINFIKRSNTYATKNTNFMALYPDRFYNNDVIVDYMSQIRDNTENNIYIHGKTLRKASGGSWDYGHELLNNLYENSVLQGIKEEHSNLQSSYDFVCGLNSGLDVIVAGGSMRRFEFLESAGANSFLSGVGNFFPEIEKGYLLGDKEIPLEMEKKLFNVFMSIGWHKSLRIGLDIMGLTCYYNRSPWPAASKDEINKISSVLEYINEEK